jgi:hypothetical protein
MKLPHNPTEVSKLLYKKNIYCTNTH